MAYPDPKPISIEACGEHPSPPTTDEIKAALVRWQEKGLETCMVCGLTVPTVLLRLSHMPQFFEGIHQWEISNMLFRTPMLTLKTDFHAGSLHVACAKAALPFASWLKEEEEDIAEKAIVLRRPRTGEGT